MIDLFYSFWASYVYCTSLQFVQYLRGGASDAVVETVMNLRFE